MKKLIILGLVALAGQTVYSMSSPRFKELAELPESQTNLLFPNQNHVFKKILKGYRDRKLPREEQLDQLAKTKYTQLGKRYVPKKYVPKPKGLFRPQSAFRYQFVRPEKPFMITGSGSIPMKDPYKR